MRPPVIAGRRAAALLLLVLAIGLASPGCERERRSQRELPPGAAAFPSVQNVDLVAGPPLVQEFAGAYQENRWAVSQGHMLYVQFNCAGCHAPGGGGGIGPPLVDDHWIYGSEPENIFETIVKGRPNGMPAYRGRIANAQTWQLVAYVRSLSGLTPSDTRVARTDNMQQTRPERAAPARVAPLSP